MQGEEPTFQSEERHRKTEFKEMGRLPHSGVVPGCSVSRGKAPPNSPQVGRENATGELWPSGDVRMSVHLSGGQEGKGRQRALHEWKLLGLH